MYLEFDLMDRLVPFNNEVNAKPRQTKSAAPRMHWQTTVTYTESWAVNKAAAC